MITYYSGHVYHKNMHITWSFLFSVIGKSVSATALRTYSSETKQNEADVSESEKKAAIDQEKLTNEVKTLSTKNEELLVC